MEGQLLHIPEALSMACVHIATEQRTYTEVITTYSLVCMCLDVWGPLVPDKFLPRLRRIRRKMEHRYPDLSIRLYYQMGMETDTYTRGKELPA